MAEWSGHIAFIQIAPAASEGLVSLTEVETVAGKGLVGDRYFKGIGTYSNKPGGGREITLIEHESLDAMKRDLKIELSPTQSRRNIVTIGVALNHLVGRQFRLGREVVLQGVRLCEPCEHLENLTSRGVNDGLVHRGGLRADIVRCGKIKVGDTISPI